MGQKIEVDGREGKDNMKHDLTEIIGPRRARLGCLEANL